MSPLGHQSRVEGLDCIREYATPGYRWGMKGGDRGSPSGGQPFNALPLFHEKTMEPKVLALIHAQLELRLLVGI